MIQNIGKYYYLHIQGMHPLPWSELKTDLAKQQKLTNYNFIYFFCDRSGSSFIGDLLSAGPKAAYFFEPFYSLKVEGQPIKAVLKRDPSQFHHVEQFIQGIFNCSSSILHQLQLDTQHFEIIRKGGLSCANSNPRVVKTIRLHRTGLEPWIYKTDIKVSSVT